MSNEIILNADLRVRTGTNKTREIRREDSMVPAIIYGNEEESKNIKLKLKHHCPLRLSTAFHIF